MYLLDDKSSAIREVQRFLFVIGQRLDIPHLSIDGYYDEETFRAVRAFQEMNELEPNGAVDRETFDMIYKEYVKIQSELNRESVKFDADEFPLELGDNGNGVSYLNALIRELSIFYKDLPASLGSFYSVATESAVKMLQCYFRTEENGKTSIELLEIIENEAIERQKFAKHNIT